MNALSRRAWTGEDLELIEQLAIIEARESFWAFRRYMNPDMIVGWWQHGVALELQNFYEELVAGLAPVWVLEAPPQHGKTRQVTEFVCWLAGKQPHMRSILASYSDELGIGVNQQIQRLMDSEKYANVFPETRLYQGGARFLKTDRDSGKIAWVGQKGSFENTTVEGQITGKGLDFGWVDDPLKGRAEAQSKTIRDKKWAWLIDDFFTRFSESAGLLMVMTRWHVDDPVGRFITHFKDVKRLRYAALAVKDEDFRRKDEPLFPQHKSKHFLLKRKKVMTLASWESLYQQNPIIVGGGEFPIEKITPMVGHPPRGEIKRSVRYWDKAGTAGGGAYTAGVLMHELKDGRIVVGNVKRGQWGALQREAMIKQTCAIDAALVGRLETWVEQEPGSGGKESAERTIANLRGYTVKADKVTGSKELRAEPYAAQVQGGNVWMVVGDWNRDFLDEHENFPNGKYKDQVDAAGGAFAKLIPHLGNSYKLSRAWL
jgi:predicted phage terminase large subunit-like protein